MRNEGKAGEARLDAVERAAAKAVVDLAADAIRAEGGGRRAASRICVAAIRGALRAIDPRGDLRAYPYPDPEAADGMGLRDAAMARMHASVLARLDGASDWERGCLARDEFPDETPEGGGVTAGSCT